MMLNKRIYIAGHNGMVGSAIYRKMLSKGYQNLLVAPRSELDLLNYNQVEEFFIKNKPEVVILAAAKVGGIQANIDNPATFLFENLAIQNNIIHLSYIHKVERLVFLGSSCIYPKESPQPMKEEYLLTGKLEPTNEGYAISKIAGLKMVEAYQKQYGLNSISLMPCNLYGPNDSFDLQHSHVLSALVKRFTDATEKGDSSIVLWGTGIARREFMHVDDVAEGTLYMLNNYNKSNFINIGWGTDISIKELAELIALETGFKGRIDWNINKPDGMLRKCMDVGKMKALGFEPKITLLEGVKQMITIYKQLKVG